MPYSYKSFEGGAGAIFFEGMVSYCLKVLRDAGAIFFALLSAPTALNSGAQQNKTRRRITSDESF